VTEASATPVPQEAAPGAPTAARYQKLWIKQKIQRHQAPRLTEVVEGGNSGKRKPKLCCTTTYWKTKGNL